MLETIFSPIIDSLSLTDALQSLGTHAFGILAQTPATADEVAQVAENNWQGVKDVGLFLLAAIVPFVLGKFFSNRLKMPNHSMAFSWILLSIIVTGIVIATGKLKLGPDIQGGTNLIYQIDQTTVGNSGQRVVAKDFIAPILNRINPSGMNESVVRPAGDDKIEIIIADVDPSEIQQIKRNITEAGILQFRIVANLNDHEELIKVAKTQAENPDPDVRLSRDVKLPNRASGALETVGIWRTLGRTAEQSGAGEVQGYVPGDTIRNARTGEILNPVLSGRPNDFENWLDSQKIRDVDILLSLQKNGVPYVEVNGADLSRAGVEIGKNGGYQVSFKMTTAGAEKMLKMTIANQPDVNTGFKRRMAILLDGNVLSAPSLNSPIRQEGQIEGNFSKGDVEFLVNILNSGSRSDQQTTYQRERRRCDDGCRCDFQGQVGKWTGSLDNHSVRTCLLPFFRADRNRCADFKLGYDSCEHDAFSPTTDPCWSCRIGAVGRDECRRKRSGIRANSGRASEERYTADGHPKWV
jgi:SecD/SecF fusion protein